jgi:transcription elongation factor GreA
MLGLEPNAPAKVTLPAGEATLTLLSIRNPTQAEIDTLLAEIKPPEIDLD